MQIQGSYEFQAPCDVVWQALLDPEVMAKAMPGCQALEQAGEDEYRGKLNIRVGPVQGVFQGKVKLSDVRAPDGYEIQLNAQGPAGTIDGSGAVRLEPMGETTRMHYTGDANVNGRIASVGQRIMDTSARVITKQSLDNLDRAIQARLAQERGISPPPDAPQPAADEPPAAAPAPTPPTGEPAADQSELAARIAGALFDEFVPKEKQPWVLAALGLFVFLLVSNWWTDAIARRIARRLAAQGESPMSK